MDIDNMPCKHKQDGGKSDILPHDEMALPVAERRIFCHTALPQVAADQFIPNIMIMRTQAVRLHKQLHDPGAVRIQIDPFQRIEIVVAIDLRVDPVVGHLAVFTHIAEYEVCFAFFRLAHERTEPMARDLVVAVHKSDIIPRRALGARQPRMKQALIFFQVHDPDILMIVFIALQNLTRFIRAAVIDADDLEICIMLRQQALQAIL